MIPNNVQSSSSVSVNDANIMRSQNNDKFAGEFSKAGLIIAVAGKIEAGKAVLTEITVTEKGKEAKKHVSLDETPIQYRVIIMQLVPLRRRRFPLPGGAVRPAGEKGLSGGPTYGPPFTAGRPNANGGRRPLTAATNPPQTVGSRRRRKMDVDPP